MARERKKEREKGERGERKLRADTSPATAASLPPASSRGCHLPGKILDTTDEQIFIL